METPWPLRTAGDRISHESLGGWEGVWVEPVAPGPVKYSEASVGQTWFSSWVGQLFVSHAGGRGTKRAELLWSLNE